MPARRKKRKTRSKRSKPKKRYFYFFIGLLLFLIILFFLLRTKLWNKNEKLNLLVRNKDSFSVVVLDPLLDEVYIMKVPENTEIDVAGDLGRWKVRSLWDLGKQENLEGKLAARTMIMGLGLPVYAWADEEAFGLMSSGLRSSIIALFSSYKTNLSFGDKVQILLFSSKVKNTKRAEYDLGETGLLEKNTLSDGTQGYEVSKTPPQNILAIFSEPYFSQGAVRVSIKDVNDNPDSTKKVGRVLEVLGGKLSLVKTASDFKGVCRVSSKKKTLLDTILKIFDCEEALLDEKQAFDLEITLGEKFTEVY
jgi:hypothetical protein